MKKKRFRAQIVGATGYGGLGMTEQLLRHPEIEVTALLAKTDVGKPISDFFPHLRGFCDRVVEEAHEDRIGQEADVVIFSTPDRVSMQYAPRLHEAGVAVLDYSGDFRFQDISVYERYAKRQPSVAGKPHDCPELLPKSAYGVPELFREDVRGAKLVGNPGCFSIAMELALAPALKAGLVEPRGLIVDGKTGVSGAGKKPTPAAGREHHAVPGRRPPARRRGGAAPEPLRRRRGRPDVRAARDPDLARHRVHLLRAAAVGRDGRPGAGAVRRGVPRRAVRARAAAGRRAGPEGGARQQPVRRVGVRRR
jgi:hypothetical protein